MKRLILTVVVLMFVFSTPAVAQQAGDNVNVLPVVRPTDSDGDPIEDWFLKGDGYLQRQVEPTIAASTLNSDHLLAFFNDYRAVDQVADDIGLGEGNVAVAALKIARLFMPPALGSNLPRLQLVPPMNAAEAWIGGTRSTDGGFTWSGFYLPGAPANFYSDGTPPEFSEAAPIFGMEAATDPVLAPGPCGTYYLVGVAFTRGGESNIFVARYRDTNNVEDGDPFVYEGMTVIESGNNAEYGYFLDKPDIEVDPYRYSAAKGKPQDPPGEIDQCGHRVYVTYSTFNGLTKDGKVQTKMNFAVSEDGGETYTTQKINKNWGQNQGSAIAVDPRPGTPTTTGGGTIYVFWRHFFDPHAMIFTKSTTFGARWTAPVVINDTPLVPFDQPTISVAAAESLFPALDYPNSLNPGFPETAFRSNAFPTAAVAVHPDPGQPGEWIATPYVAWQERVGNGQPGIVMMRSQDEGLTWGGFSPVTGADGPRQAVDKRARLEPFDPYLVMPPAAPAPVFDGLGGYQHDRPAGGQVQPKLSFAGGQLMLTFYESRGRIKDLGTGNEELVSDSTLVDLTPYLTGYDRVMDFRGALLNPENGKYASPGFQISRYPIRGGANLIDGQDLLDVAAINAPCFPDDPGVTEVCVRQVNTVNYPTSALGSSPFIGDYPDTVPYAQFIPDGTGWRWAIEAGDVPNPGFHAIWTDNRHISPPTEVFTDPETLTKASLADTGVDVWDAYQYYGPPSIGGACINPGSRNTDVLTSRVNSEVILRAPTTFKQLDEDRGFPFTISNQTNEFRRFTVTITEGDQYATLSPIENPDGTWVNQDSKTITVFPYSSAALTLFVPLPQGVEPGPDVDQTVDVGTLRIQVVFDEFTTDPDTGTENTAGIQNPVPWTLCPGNCLVGTLAFNAFNGNLAVNRIDDQPEEFGPTIGNAFVINWELDNAFVINNYLDNAFVINSELDNAFVINTSDPNAFVINAFVINAFVINSGLEAKAGTGDEEPGIYGVTDVVWTMKPGSSNTAGSFLPLINIDDAELYLENEEYAFQLIVDKPSSYGSAAECTDYATSVYQQQVLSNVVQNPGDPNAFVINKSPENAFVINNQEPNAFVINSTFALAPAESESKSTGTTWKVGEPINDSEGRADPPSDEVRVTLRVFQLVKDPAHDFNPDPGEGGWLPSVAVADIGCGGAPGESPSDCFTIDGPNLIPSSNVVATTENPLTVDLCGVLEFEAGAFTVSNPNLKDGTKPAVTRDADELQRHGFFLVGAEPSNQHVDIRIGEYTWLNPLDVDASAPSPALSFSIPASVEEGLYTLVFFADDPLKVSEYDETDNTLEFPVVVESGATFEGLQSPLFYNNIHPANNGSAVPLMWRYVDSVGAATDSSGAMPVITFSGWSADCSTYDPETTPAEISFSREEDPGSSGLRYDSLTSSWQFNWQTKYPNDWTGEIGAPGDPLPEGCWEIEITSTFTCDEQADGPFLVNLD